MAHQSLKFRFSGKLARLLGRESVSSDTAALFELVKNGYDADASKVTVTFENLVANDGRDARIVVEDSGEGMTYDEIVNKWMVVGTYSKDRETITKGGRTVVGNKGVGRFATEKLARKVTVVSWPQATAEEIRLDIDWTKFEDENVQFGDVEIPIGINPNRSKPDRHGLKIILTDLREKWDDTKIRRLRASVSSIVLPAELQHQGKKFVAKIYARDFEEQIPARVESLLFSKAPYALSAILPDKRSRTTLQIKKKGSLVDSKIVDCENEGLPSGHKWKPFGGCEVKVYVYPRDSRLEMWSDHYSNVLKLSHKDKIIQQNCGLKIYRDDFWVSPYGGPGNDWAGLEAARVQSNLRAGNTQIIGFVKITKEKNKEIRDTTSRESLEENVAFESLKLFIKRIFDEFLSFRTEEVKALKEQNPKVRAEAIRSVINKLADEINENQQIDAVTKQSVKKSIKRLKNVIVSYRNQSESDYAELVAQQRMYRSLAALGISSAASYHEIFNIVTDMGTTPKAIRKKLADNHVKDDLLDCFVDGLDRNIRTIAHYAWFIREFVQGVGNTIEKPKKEKMHIKNEMKLLWNDFAGLANTKVVFTVRCHPNDLTVFMNRADFLSIVLNMLTNSLKALDGQDRPEKKILVAAHRAPTSLEIKFSDNGIGVADDIQEKIFRPLYSTYTNGTGMGLSIVSEILDNYGGKIKYLPNGEFNGGATFLLQIPWVNISDE